MKRILIIDDNEDILFALSEICHYKKWEPFIANNVEKGIDVFKSEQIDLIIIDYHMPIINGMIGVKLLRALSREVPILVLTVEESQDVADAFIEAGASDFALKPIKAPDLISRLSVHLSYNYKQTNNISYKDYVKGISITTLEIIENYMKKCDGKMTISSISKGTGLAYQTVHRYLQHFIDHGVVELEQDYGKIGRPKQYFSWVD